MHIQPNRQYDITSLWTESGLAVTYITPLGRSACRPISSADKAEYVLLIILTANSLKFPWAWLTQFSVESRRTAEFYVGDPTNQGLYSQSPFLGDFPIGKLAGELFSEIEFPFSRWRRRNKGNHCKRAWIATTARRPPPPYSIVKILI